MKNILYNKKHLREYVGYGLAAAIAFIIPLWITLAISDYNQVGLVFIGSILFMFVIMAYAIRLSGRRPEYKSTWMMIIAGHMAVLAGITLCTLLTFLLCAVYIPGFPLGNSRNVLEDAPSGLNNQNWSLISLIFLCATIANFGAGGFIAILGPYVFKKNQTKDKTAVLDAHISPSHHK